MQDSEKDRSTETTGKSGQHWRGEPWAKNPKVGGKESDTETGEGPSGQHWRGDEPPPERKEQARGTGAPPQTSTERRGPEADDRPDEC